MMSKIFILFVFLTASVHAQEFTHALALKVYKLNPIFAFINPIDENNYIADHIVPEKVQTYVDDENRLGIKVIYGKQELTLNQAKAQANYMKEELDIKLEELQNSTKGKYEVKVKVEQPSKKNFDLEYVAPVEFPVGGNFALKDGFLNGTIQRVKNNKLNYRYKFEEGQLVSYTYNKWIDDPYSKISRVDQVIHINDISPCRVSYDSAKDLFYLHKGGEIVYQSKDLASYLSGHNYTQEKPHSLCRDLNPIESCEIKMRYWDDQTGEKVITYAYEVNGQQISQFNVSNRGEVMDWILENVPHTFANHDCDYPKESFGEKITRTLSNIGLMQMGMGYMCQKSEASYLEQELEAYKVEKE